MTDPTPEASSDAIVHDSAVADPRSPSAPRQASTPVAPSSEEAKRVHDQIYWSLSQVWDPELGLDIVSLGLIYDIRIEGNRVDIDMTLTTPGCPVSDTMPEEARMKAQGALPDYEVNINVVWDPPWSPERLSPEALESLGFRG